MPAYVIFIREKPIRDQSAMDTYSRMNREAPRDPHLKALAVYGALETLEGPTADGVILLQFPTVEDAKAWYNSPAYQAAIPYRKKGADYRAIIVQGV
jgi:uncharacterized protein (DUF1330 family)